MLNMYLYFKVCVSEGPMVYLLIHCDVDLEILIFCIKVKTWSIVCQSFFHLVPIEICNKVVTTLLFIIACHFRHFVQDNDGCEQKNVDFACHGYF